MINNPYIDLVKQHDKILTLESEIYDRAGKWSDIFENLNEIVLEIGTGLWNFFSKQVTENPDKNFVWMEIRYKRLYLTAEKCLWNKSNYAQSNLAPLPLGWKEGAGGWNYSNFILLKEYGQKIGEIFAENELSETYIFFPDPWAKKKSQLKNRLIQKQFLDDLYLITKTWWKCIIKTDHRWYFDFVLEEMKKTEWRQKAISYDFENEEEFKNSETTEFQQLFRGQDLKVHYLELVK